MPMIEHTEGKVSVRKQCKLLGINRSRVYYKEKPVNDMDIEIVNDMIEINKQTPFYGYCRITVVLENLGHKVNHKKTQRLMQKTGLKALYPKKRTTIPNSMHKKYPYLLRDLTIDRPNQVWSIDITYIKTKYVTGTFILWH